ncbi:MAG: hypothetical protein QOJ60_2346 [Actinomycetota bacterium]|jgi:hypothetical protein|nr:hypothetical protein [Actinomycetota bacterium]
MTEQRSNPPSRDLASGGALSLVAERDVLEVEVPAGRLGRILHEADERDRVAEQRDRVAERREFGTEGPAPTLTGDPAAVDRLWAGRDRDAAAGDRADLVLMLHQRDGT